MFFQTNIIPTEKEIQTKTRFKQNSFQIKVFSYEGRCRYGVVSDTRRFETSNPSQLLLAPKTSIQCQLLQKTSNEEIWNQKFRPEGQNFVSKSPAPYT